MNVEVFLRQQSPHDLMMFCGLAMLVLLAFMPRRRAAKRGKADPFLDRSIFQWDYENSLTVRDLTAGGIHVFGGTGTGKTSSFKQVARAIIGQGASMLWLCGKKDEYLDVLKLAKEAGRLKDVIVVDPQHKNYVNMIGHEASREGDGAGMPTNVTRFVMNVREVVLRESQQSGGDSQFWKQQDERTIYAAVTVLMLAGEEVTPGNITQLVLSAPQSLAEAKSDDWHRGYCAECLKKADAACVTEMQNRDFNNAGGYFMREWPGLGEKTRGSVLMGTMATLAPLNTGLAQKMFGDATTFSITKAIATGKIVVVNMPPDEFGDLGRIANAGLKHLWQLEVLRRKVTKGSRVSVIWGDEASQWVTSFDASYLSRCRSYLGSMVYLTQSLASYRDVLPGEKADASINALLGNFSTKVFFALGDYDTAEWAANLVGKELRTLHGGSTQEGDFEPFAIFPDRAKVTSSFNESMEFVLRPEQFISGLRTGAPSNGYQVDAIMVRFGGVFANGYPVNRVTFDQRR